MPSSQPSFFGSPARLGRTQHACAVQCHDGPFASVPPSNGFAPFELWASRITCQATATRSRVARGAVERGRGGHGPLSARWPYSPPARTARAHADEEEA
jgi:hypothetical protein